MPKEMNGGTGHTHQLQLGRLGAVVVRLTFQATEISAAVDVPGKLPRKYRRLAERWLDKIIRPLDADPRMFRVVVTSNGKIVSTASELNGIGAVIFAK